MKKLSRLRSIGFCLALLVFLVTCRPIPEYAPEPLPAYGAVFWGEVTATRNALAFMNPRILASLGYASNTPACNPSVFNIAIREFDKGGCERASLNFAGLPRGVRVSEQFQQSWKLAPCTDKPLLPHVIFQVSECDVAFGEYLLAPSKLNRVEITTYDTQTQEVKGSFDLYFAVNRRPMPTAPDSLHCVGTFKTKLLPEGKLRYD